MCHIYRLMYACGCRIKDPYNFHQCVERQGTNAKCDPIKVLELEKDHYCAKHLVGRGGVIMAFSRRRRPSSEDNEDHEEMEEEEEEDDDDDAEEEEEEEEEKEDEKKTEEE
ncbi:hypothetical protein BO86DRAFT_386665 [Aspergillus japonicus CBS 114.51]|uniref:Uncharacterized protein n=1 Tax=Aspergillus japonicus CBS 114.51 TaxID=1448312 RepID=A0A8T8XAC5_ASPJA|nr:hypothetical protein BO86DRAFT_386665 [Aspergillus japonicus CBS 114.51]RAH85136.1 hypothetical protein BO86DRAFT_386665 [Aspergillus japonicus CBS 114.51]